MAGDGGDPHSRDSVLSALFILGPGQFARLTRSLSADAFFRLRRLSSLLLSPAAFRRVLCLVESLPLRSKTLLLARLLLRSLRLLTLPLSSAAGHLPATDPDELDAGLLLLALCRVSASGGSGILSGRSDWRKVLADHVAAEALRLSGLGDSGHVAVAACIDEAMDCRRFIEAVGSWKGSCPTAAAAAVEAVASLTAGSEGGGGVSECVICREEVSGDTCALPCSHEFHLACVRRWLMRVNTCPTCRFELPTDDVFFEIERLWRVISARSRSSQSCRAETMASPRSGWSAQDPHDFEPNGSDTEMDDSD